jgi:sarcosine oxidase subunit beta
VSGLFRRSRFLHERPVRSRYDVVVVGGGVVGTAIAYYLASRHGVRDVAVLERSYLGSGASTRNTQVVRANYNTPETVPLYKASLEIWRSLSQDLDFNVQFSTQGELDVCHSADSLEVERDKSLLNRAYGVRTDILTPEEVVAVCPLIDLSAGGERPIVGASFHPPGSFARHDSVVWGFATAADRLGVDLHERLEVTGIDVVRGRCVGVQTPAGSIAAGCVVNATAGYSSLLAEMAGVRLPIVTHPLQAFVTEPYAHVLDGLVSSMDLYVYVSQTPRGELLVGAEILPYNTYSTRSTYDFLTEAAKRSIQLLPFMAKARVMRQWAGLCDMTPDSSPILGESEVERFFLACGMGTWGFKGSPIFGRTMADVIATGRTDPLIAPFAPGRFRIDRMVPDAASAGTH